MTTPSPVANHKAQHDLKVFMEIGDFRRRAEKLIARGFQGPVNYALQNYYLGANEVFCVDHGSQTSNPEDA